jgi:hypothetical protein
VDKFSTAIEEAFQANSWYLSRGDGVQKTGTYPLIHVTYCYSYLFLFSNEKRILIDRDGG